MTKLCERRWAAEALQQSTSKSQDINTQDLLQEARILRDIITSALQTLRFLKSIGQTFHNSEIALRSLLTVAMGECSFPKKSRTICVHQYLRRDCVSCSIHWKVWITRTLLLSLLPRKQDKWLSCNSFHLAYGESVLFIYTTWQDCS